MQFWHRSTPLAVVCATWLAICGISAAQQPDAELARTINELILKLDDDKFQVREDAAKALVAIGAAASDALAKATKSDSAEVRQRAVEILRGLKRARLGLRHLATVRRDDLLGVCGITTSSDGKFLYGATLQASTLAVFRRDEAAGALTHIQTVVDPAVLRGAICIKLSPDGKLAVATTYHSSNVSLWARDPDAGTLALLNVAGPDLGDGMLLARVVDAAFSPDGKHVYAVAGASGIAAFEVARGPRLSFVQLHKGRDESLQGARSVAVSSDGRTVVVTSNTAGAVTVFDRDAASGKVEPRQVLRDGEGKISALAGVHGVVLSPDGLHAYFSVGRHFGDPAVAAYRFEKDGKLTLVQEQICEGELAEIAAPNGLWVSPDGRHVYVCATNSQSLACFERDAKSGELLLIDIIRNSATGASVPIGAADVDTSPDGRFVHVALEGEGAISIFERTPPK
jgi:6-phosphogluconolactonase (cycloisomerase 2 family)